MPNAKRRSGKKIPAGSTAVYVRMPNVLIAEVEAYRDGLVRRAGIGVTISRASAMHQLIREGLAAQVSA